MRRTLAVAACVALPALAAGRAAALGLGEGLAIVARQGRDLARAAAEDEVQSSAPPIAAAPRKPTVDVYARETLLAYQPAAVVPQGSFPLAEQQSLAYGVRVRQLLYDFGRVSASHQAALLDTEAKHLDAALARNRSALLFIQTYLRLLLAERRTTLAKDEVARLEAHRADTEAMLEAGTITEHDLLEVDVRLADAVQRRLQAENQRSLAAAQLNSLLLRPLSQEVATESVPEVSTPPAPERPLEDALAAAARERAELRQVQARMSAAEGRRDAARAEFYPQLYLAGGYDYAQNQYQVHEGNWSVVAGIDFNVFAGGVTKERLRQRESELRVMAQIRDQIRDAVALEVQDAYLARRNARSRVGATEKAVAQAREFLRLQQLRYAEGVGTATEVLDAVTLASTAEQNYLNARYDVTEAQARLDFAVGKDLVAAWGGEAPRADGGATHE